MRKILAICLICLTSICEGTSQDGQTVYVDREGWVIGANKSTSKHNNLFKTQKKQIVGNSLGTMVPSEEELGLPPISKNNWLK